MAQMVLPIKITKAINTIGIAAIFALIFLNS
jgi:hypothetical protein